MMTGKEEKLDDKSYSIISKRIPTVLASQESVDELRKRLDVVSERLLMTEEWVSTVKQSFHDQEQEIYGHYKMINNLLELARGTPVNLDSISMMAERFAVINSWIEAFNENYGEEE